MTFVPPGHSGTLSSLVRGAAVGLRRRFRRLFRPARHSKPVFVVGCGRSGTDLVIAALLESSATEVFNERNHEAFVRFKLRDLSIIDRLVERSRADVVAFKSITETHRTRELLDHWPDARSVFVVRNPWDTIRSIVRFFRNVGAAPRAWAVSESQSHGPSHVSPELHQRFLELFAVADSTLDLGALTWWVRNSGFLEMGLTEEPRAAVIDYDDMTRDAESVFLALCRFLDIPYSTTMPSLVHRRSPGTEVPDLSPMIREACADLWRNIERAARPRRLGLPDAPPGTQLPGPVPPRSR